MFHQKSDLLTFTAFINDKNVYVGIIPGDFDLQNVPKVRCVFFMVVVPMLLRDGVVGKSSWKEREVGKFNLESLKLESFCLSWKEPSEVGKKQAKLERTDQSWKVSFEV